METPQEIPLADIKFNPHQPRTEFDDSDIRSLAESIGQNGILQPLSVRKSGEKYELIAGESPYKSPTDMGVNMAGNCIVDDEVCCEASQQEILRRYYKCLCDKKRNGEIA